jgi:hypothetical protein
MYNNTLVLLIVICLILFIITVKLVEYIPKRYHGNIHLLRSLGTFLIICGAVVTYYKEKNDQIEQENKEYSEGVLKSFDEIDMFILSNYKELSPILSIFYSKIQIPSSDKNLNDILKNISEKTKDTLFVLYNKLTTIFEKMYLINTDLFNNYKLGLRVKMYIDSMLYYEFWSVTKRIYNTNFIIFMEDRYKFLTVSDFRYNKPDRIMDRIPYMNDVSFIFKSPKNNGLWY